MYTSAIEQLDAGDIRDAAEQAWCATKRATDALILARTGVEPERSPETSRQLNELARRDPGVEGLVGRFYSRQAQLHGECFSLGLCEPVEATTRRIRETVAYITDAEALADETG
jgi:hypothetical protein